MRAIALSSLLLAAAALPAAASAQQGPTRSVDDYVCAFTDECADAAPTDDAAAATAEGATEVTVGGRKARASNTRGFSLARPKAATSAAAPATAAKTSGTRQTAGARPRVSGQVASISKARINGAAGAKTKSAASAARRVDLRLSFQTGSATLTPQAMEEAQVFAEALKGPKLADRRFTIEGHTDSVGSRAYNLDLSRRRAQAVKDYLTSLGVPASRLQTVGYGFDRPIEGLSARAEENRRVEAVLGS